MDFLLVTRIIWIISDPLTVVWNDLPVNLNRNYVYSRWAHKIFSPQSLSLVLTLLILMVNNLNVS